MDYEKIFNQFSEKYIIIEKEALEKILEKIDNMKKEILEEVKKNNLLNNEEFEIESG